MWNLSESKKIKKRKSESYLKFKTNKQHETSYTAFSQYWPPRSSRKESNMTKQTKIKIVEGNLLHQNVEVIVNAWNRNFIPHWLLVPQGVSKSIRRAAGTMPFRELSRYGLLPLGGAVLTTAGRLPFKGIIHVAGIGLCWTSSEKAIRFSVINALGLANGRFHSLAFPLIGAGTGGMTPKQVETIMIETIKKSEFVGEITIVRFKNKSKVSSNGMFCMDWLMNNIFRKIFKKMAKRNGCNT